MSFSRITKVKQSILGLIFIALYFLTVLVTSTDCDFLPWWYSQQLTMELVCKKCIYQYASSFKISLKEPHKFFSDS